MYLSSWRLGDDVERLLELSSGSSAAVVANAMDAADGVVRRDAVQLELDALGGLGFQPVEVDLRLEGAAGELASFDVVWVRGGNVFVLREALASSGADLVLRELVTADAVVYAGYSAGCCVLGPTLRGLEFVDDPTAVDEPRWDGLGLLDYVFLPHYRSDHPESAAIERVVADYERRGLSHRRVRDGEVVVVDSS
ncbi:Type 1 glutamine amidotransferase-like domain-containing protein [Sphaerisporangium album]|nr:Type 1 glutamine amidotransferase-like domain-containing protein [Sphaerisporangium album]